MASNRGRSTSPQRPSRPPQPSVYAEDDSIINTRQIEAFSRTVQATASQLISANFPHTHHSSSSSSSSPNDHPHPLLTDPYHSALSTVHRSLRRPMIQRSVFSFAKAHPRELIRSNFNTSEIEHRAITYLPDELLRNVPQSRNAFSLLDGFRASLPEVDEEDEDEDGGGAGSLAERVSSKRRRGGRHSRQASMKLLEGGRGGGPPQLLSLRREKHHLDHKLEMMGIRKTMCVGEIKEIDEKIGNLNAMRRVCLDRLADLEMEEHDLEGEIGDLAERMEVLEESLGDEGVGRSGERTPEEEEGEDEEGGGFMSESIYEKLPKISSSSKNQDSPRSTNKTKKRKNHHPPKRTSMPVLHEHMDPGSRIREMQAHNDIITALDFDAPFGTMVTAALDDTVRVWDLNAGRCMGLLEGHLSSVRCLQVEENLVATGSMDASIRLWDLSQADYDPQVVPSSHLRDKSSRAEDREEGERRSGEGEKTSSPSSPSPSPAAATGEDLFTSSKSDDDGEGENFATPPNEIEQPPPPHATNAMADCALFTLQAHVAEITALHFRGNTLVSGSADKTLRQWDLERGRCVQTLDVLWAAAQQASTINPNTSTSASAGNGANATSDSSSGGGTWWRPTSGRVPTAEADFVGALQVFDAALACGTADGMVRLWDLRSGMVHRSLVGHTGPVTALQFDDVFLVTGSRDRSIRIWDLRTGTIHDAFAYDNPISSMMFDARRIVAAAGEDVVKVYDKTDGRQWDCGAGALASTDGSERKAGIVERVRIKDGYAVEGRRDGVVGVWSC